MEGPIDASATPPFGEYHFRTEALLRAAAVLIVPAVIISLWAILSLELDGAASWLLAVGAFGVAFSPMYLAGLSFVGRLRGGPRLAISEDGIQLEPWGLWTLVPFLSVPKILIPWSDVQAIEPVPGAKSTVLLQRRGEQKRWWERIVLPANRPPGRLVMLTFLGGQPAELQESLLAWSEDRLRLEVRRLKAEGLAPGSGEDAGLAAPSQPTTGPTPLLPGSQGGQ